MNKDPDRSAGHGREDGGDFGPVTVFPDLVGREGIGALGIMGRPAGLLAGPGHAGLRVDDDALALRDAQAQGGEEAEGGGRGIASRVPDDARARREAALGRAESGDLRPVELGQAVNRGGVQLRKGELFAVPFRVGSLVRSEAEIGRHVDEEGAFRRTGGGDILGVSRGEGGEDHVRASDRLGLVHEEGSTRSRSLSECPGEIGIDRGHGLAPCARRAQHELLDVGMTQEKPRELRSRIAGSSDNRANTHRSFSNRASRRRTWTGGDAGSPGDYAPRQALYIGCIGNINGDGGGEEGGGKFLELR